MAENTLRMALHSIGFKVTVHGMRSVVTDVLYEAGYSRDLIEKQLDHKDRDQVRAAYLRTNFLEQRAPMMQWFADWCVGEETATNVIPLRSS
jgi:integrase